MKVALVQNVKPGENLPKRVKERESWSSCSCQLLQVQARLLLGLMAL
jgi:hypothetical protein